MYLKNIITVVGAGLLFVVGSSWAMADEPENALQKCRIIEDNADRLVCYDKLADTDNTAQGPTVASGKMQAKRQGKIRDKPAAGTAAPTGLENAPAAQVSSGKPPQPVFGDEDLPKDRRPASARDVQLIQVNVVGFKLNAYGKALYYLENGQVWEQTDRLRPRRYSTPFAAIIKRASMGSYMIQKVDSSVRMRVQRKK